MCGVFFGGGGLGGESVYDFLGLLGKKMSILELLNQNTSRLYYMCMSHIVPPNKEWWRDILFLASALNFLSSL